MLCSTIAFVLTNESVPAQGEQGESSRNRIPAAPAQGQEERAPTPGRPSRI